MSALPLLLALLVACGVPPAERDADGDGARAAVDCDDADALRYPGAVEHCDGFDEDCDGEVDEAAEDALPWFTDRDGDGWGSAETVSYGCVEIAGTVSQGTDCDDRDDRVHPGARETCDARDEDCDGVVDNGAVDAVRAYTDADGDGYGDPATEAESCAEAPLTDGTDCDDTQASVHPGATEQCDGVDTDCDGSLDAGAIDGTRGWVDTDGDGYGADDDPGEDVCDGSTRVRNRLDCDDTDAAVNPADGGCGMSGARSPEDAALTLYGEEADDEVGASLSAGDLDGDGIAELVIGAVRGGLYDEGRVYVLRGPISGGEELEATVGGRQGDQSYDQFGFATAILADADGDGLGELAVGAIEHEEVSDSGGWGAVYVYAGPATGTTGTIANAIYGATDLDQLGYSLASAGDTDGDGVPELLAGAKRAEGSGAAYLLSTTAATLDDAVLVLLGIEANDQAGYDVAAGDLDGDGIAELIVGTGVAEDAYVVTGGTTGVVSLRDADATIGGRGGYYKTGESLTVVPDVDGDGLADLFVGGPPHSGSITLPPGESWLLTAPIRGALTLPGAAWATFTGRADNDLAGHAVAGGDVDGDGRTDLAIGASGDDAGASGGGAVYLQLGVTAGSFDLADATAILTGGVASLALGSGLVLADLDGDGRDELAVGATGESGGGEGAGAVWVFSGGAP